MQNSLQKFRQSTTVSQKPGVLSEDLKTSTSSNYPTVQYFLLKFAHISYLPLSTKVCPGLFLFPLDISYLQNVKRPGFYTLIFYTFINFYTLTQDLNEIKKSRKPFCRHN